jgi:hypothetical protein
VTSEQYVEHAYRLGYEYQVQLRLDPRYNPGQAAADPKNRIVYARPVADDTSYAVVIHEMGHVCSPGGAEHHALPPIDFTRCPDWNDIFSYLDAQVRSEEAAWEWAHEHAIEWTVGMSMVERFAKGTYYRVRERMWEAREVLGSLDSLYEEFLATLIMKDMK